MEELLVSVADAVTQAGGAAICHHGLLADVVDGDTVAVVVPHEYFALDADPAPALLGRTIGFGVEHPGTTTFESAAAIMGRLGGSVEIAADAVAEMGRRGVTSHRFVLGYRPAWDERDRHGDRDIDVVHVGTADESRLAQLAPIAVDLVGCRSELLLAPHEPMTAPRPDFVVGDAKWDLLARSRLLLNLHREGATAFEWVRALDAISNGCVVLTTPSTGLDPLVPGEHLLVAEPERIGRVARAALLDPGRLTEMADAAHDRCRDQLDMVESASRLVELAGDVHASARPWGGAAARRSPVPPPIGAASPLAEWVPTVRPLPDPGATPDPRARRMLHELLAARAELTTPPTVVSRSSDTDVEVDVVCVARAGDGPLSLTLDSLRSAGVEAAVHAGYDGVDERLARDASSPVDVVTTAAFSWPVGRGAARNRLLSSGSAPLVLVLDAGDEVLGAGLDDLVELFGERPELDVAYPLAVLGSRMVVNALVPEARRLQRFAYLDRGYVVRRSFLDRLGGFGEGPELEGFVDHHFWRRAVEAGAEVELRRHVGFRLWEQSPEPTLAELDPAATLAALVD
jgi:hypothetical protein